MEHTTPTYYIVIVSGACHWSYYQRTEVTGLIHDHFDMYLSEAREVMLCASEAHRDSWVPFVGFADHNVARKFAYRLQAISSNVYVQIGEFGDAGGLPYNKSRQLKK